MLIKSTSPLKIVSEIKNHIDDNAALISVGEKTNINITKLISALVENEVEFIGGIFPKILHDNTISDEGIVINTLKNIELLTIITNISTGEFNIPKVDFDKNKDYSLVTYVDGLTSNISNYLNALYENYGMKTNYFGGGAGSLSLEQKPCVFCKDGFFQDAAVICLMKMTSNIGVKHGWQKLDGPLIITKADKNTIQEINWKNPLESYKHIVEKDSNMKFNEDNFFDIAKGYPFGIIKSDGECVIRDPLMTDENGHLICVGEIEENTMVNIMKGDNNSLINAAASAAEESSNNSTNPQKAIIIDCISRVLFLEDNFQKELDSINGVLKNKYPEISIGGALTIGEISSYGNGYLELYNKTCVVGLFE
jgi:hypothetical protein